MNVLKNTKCYLIGSIESAVDGGRGWREWFKEDLKKMGVVVFDPCDKPFVKDFSETEEIQISLKQLRKDKKYDELSKFGKQIRIYDLALVDRSDFIVFNYNPDIPTCGSWEEFFLANREKKAIFFVCEQEDKIPLWMYWTIPHKYFYRSLEDVLKMLYDINEGKKEIDSDRWRLLREGFR